MKFDSHRKKKKKKKESYIETTFKMYVDQGHRTIFDTIGLSSRNGETCDYVVLDNLKKI